jgi:glycosyltransferase involved in cell wall biosynthesis
MKIGVIVCAYAPYRAGICVAAERHAHALVELGHDVEVICPSDDFGRGTMEIDGIRVDRRRPLVRNGLGAVMPDLLWHVRRFDALYIHLPFYGGEEPAALGARLAGIPYLAFFHMDVVLSGWRGAAVAAHRRLCTPWILRGAREVLVSSRDYLDHSTIARLRLPRVRELPYAVDTERFTPATLSGPRRQELGLGPDRKIVLFVGTLGRAGAFKGVTNLIRAVSSAPGLADHAQLVIAGDGDMRPEYAALADTLLPADAVRFAGRVSDEDLVDLYRAATVTVLPSTTQGEAFGIVLIESMACGTPVVASALPGVRGVMDRAGIATPPGDVAALGSAIALIVDDPNPTRWRDAARERAASRFSRQRERDDLRVAVSALR